MVIATAICWLLFWLISFVYSGFAIYLLWGWFLVPFGIMPISLPWAIGLYCLAALFREAHYKPLDKTENPFFTLLMINICTTGYIVVGYVAQKFGASIALVAASILWPHIRIARSRYESPVSTGLFFACYSRCFGPVLGWSQRMWLRSNPRWKSLYPQFLQSFSG